MAKKTSQHLLEESIYEIYGIEALQLAKKLRRLNPLALLQDKFPYLYTHLSSEFKQELWDEWNERKEMW